LVFLGLMLVPRISHLSGISPVLGSIGLPGGLRRLPAARKQSIDVGQQTAPTMHASFTGFASTSPARRPCGLGAAGSPSHWPSLAVLTSPAPLLMLLRLEGKASQVKGKHRPTPARLCPDEKAATPLMAPLAYGLARPFGVGHRTRSSLKGQAYGVSLPKYRAQLMSLHGFASPSRGSRLPFLPLYQRLAGSLLGQSFGSSCQHPSCQGFAP